MANINLSAEDALLVDNYSKAIPSNNGIKVTKFDKQEWRVYTNRTSMSCIPCKEFRKRCGYIEGVKADKLRCSWCTKRSGCDYPTRYRHWFVRKEFGMTEDQWKRLARLVPEIIEPYEKPDEGGEGEGEVPQLHADPRGGGNHERVPGPTPEVRQNPSSNDQTNALSDKEAEVLKQRRATGDAQANELVKQIRKEQDARKREAEKYNMAVALFESREKNQKKAYEKLSLDLKKSQDSLATCSQHKTVLQNKVARLEQDSDSVKVKIANLEKQLQEKTSLHHRAIDALTDLNKDLERYHNESKQTAYEEYSWAKMWLDDLSEFDLKANPEASTALIKKLASHLEEMAKLRRKTANLDNYFPFTSGCDTSPSEPPRKRSRKS